MHAGPSPRPSTNQRTLIGLPSCPSPPCVAQKGDRNVAPVSATDSRFPASDWLLRYKFASDWPLRYKFAESLFPIGSCVLSSLKVQTLEK